jgi:aryl carrier-like protein
MSQPIAFRTPQGVRASGYRAEVLPEVCEVWLKARDAGVLQKQQQHIAAQADILIRGLASVGIIALVDEATGYQELRAKDALARILEAFIDKELQAWIQTFPADFYGEMFRLRELDFPTDTVQRPRYFGHLTNDIVYKRLAPGVLEQLKRITPKGSAGRRKHKFFQRLTSNVGYPKLREHLGSVVAIMKLSSTWEDFMMKLDRIHPRYGDTLSLDLEYEDDNGRGL